MPEVVMPKMGDAMEEGTILRWLKKEGDRVEEEEIIAEISTEKATIEIPSEYTGVLSQILVQESQTVPVGTPIAVIGEPNGKAPKAKAKAPAKEEAPKAEAAPNVTQEQTPGADAPSPKSVDADLARNNQPTGQTSPPAAATGAEGRVKASPLAKKVAEEHGIDLSGVEGTGPGGRIIEADVEEARRRGPATPAYTLPTPAPAGPGTRRPISPMRKIIAKRLTESKQQIPHFYLTSDVDMRAATRLRSEYNAGVEEDARISFNDLVVRACALALQKWPQLNSRFEGDQIVTPGSVDIGVAVALDEGLVVPVVRGAQAKGPSALGREVRELAGRARKGQLKQEEYSGGTFTVSNLGMFDVTQFQAIINPPEAAILAVGAIRDTPIVENGQVVPGKQMYLTISVDHRLVDGHTAAQFMQEVKRRLQSPLTLLG